MVTAFAPYKRVDLAIRAANEMKRRLKIVGQGQKERYFRKLAGSTVEFLGWQSDERARELCRKCSALLFPGEEDIGIVPSYGNGETDNRVWTWRGVGNGRSPKL